MFSRRLDLKKKRNVVKNLSLPQTSLLFFLKERQKCHEQEKGQTDDSFLVSFFANKTICAQFTAHLLQFVSRLLSQNLQWLNRWKSQDTQHPSPTEFFYGFNLRFYCLCWQFFLGFSKCKLSERIDYALQFSKRMDRGDSRTCFEMNVLGQKITSWHQIGISWFQQNSYRGWGKQGGCLTTEVYTTVMPSRKLRVLGAGKPDGAWTQEPFRASDPHYSLLCVLITRRMQVPVSPRDSQRNAGKSRELSVKSRPAQRTSALSREVHEMVNFEFDFDAFVGL